MNKHFSLKAFTFVAIALFIAPITLAQSHRGQMDTDGVLSPGEIPNPRINYGNNLNNKNTHTGQVDTDGVLSPGEVRNPNIDYNPSPNDYPSSSNSRCNSISRRDLPRPIVDIGTVKQTGNVFGSKVKVRGSVEGTCLSEAGLFENGRKVQSIPINTTDRFNRFEFEVKTNLDNRPEVRVYNVVGDRDIQYINKDY